VARSKPKPVQPEDRSLEIDDEEDAAEARTGAGSAPASGIRITKAEATRQAIEAGMDSPDDGIDFIFKKFGIEMSKPHFSAAKSTLKKKGAFVNARPGRRPRREKAPSRAIEGYLAPPPRQHTSPSSEILDAMEAMKPLIASLGKDQIHRMIDLLG
jgi:hypothetical protein